MLTKHPTTRVTKASTEAGRADLIVARRCGQNINSMSGVGIPAEKLVLYGKTLTLNLIHPVTCWRQNSVYVAGGGSWVQAAASLDVHPPRDPGKAFNPPEHQIPHLENEANVLPRLSSLKRTKVRGIKPQERI